MFKIYQLFASKDESQALAEKYRAGNFGYGHAKMELLDKVKIQFSESRDQFFDFMSRPDDLVDIIQTGAKRAKEIAQPRLDAVQSACGLIGRMR